MQGRIASIATLLAATSLAMFPPAAGAEFPWHMPLGPDRPVPNDLDEDLEWKYAASPEPNPGPSAEQKDQFRDAVNGAAKEAKDRYGAGAAEVLAALEGIAGSVPDGAAIQGAAEMIVMALGAPLPADPGDALVEAFDQLAGEAPPAGSLDPHELQGIRGASLVDRDRDLGQAWHLSTGRPDVAIAVLDSGIRWNDAGAMRDLRLKTRLNDGELPAPAVDRAGALNSNGGPARDCADYDGAGDDRNEDGVFNVDDFACDSRVEMDPALRGGLGDGPADVLDPQDVLIAFSDSDDDDDNGYEDDMVGWDFLDDDNDPFDDVQYGHGTGEARDSVAEADNGGELGACPNCMAMHLRVGDSFIADANRFGQAVLYATDNGALVVQEALGTLNNTSLGQRAVDYAYEHGVVVIASAADEAAQHHNYPSNYEHTVVVNSVTRYTEADPVPRSYLKFNGCTNFSSKITASVPSVSCSSEATGRGAGMAALIYAAAIERIEDGSLVARGDCRLAAAHPVTGRDCPVTANEVRQLLASGALDGAAAVPPATDGGEPGWQTAADDVNFADVELSCALAPLALCTDPNLNSAGNLAVAAPLPTRRYPARAGHDQFYGYGRLNLNRALTWLAGPGAPLIPPEAEIDSPEWFEMVDPGQAKLEVRGRVNARRYPAGSQLSCSIEIAPGAQPGNRPAGQAAPGAPSPGDFHPARLDAGAFCDGSSRDAEGHTGLLGVLDVADLKAKFPPETREIMKFAGREPGLAGHSFNGRPNSDPYSFTVRVRVQVASGGVTRRGEDRRNAFLHRDQDMVTGFPRRLDSDGESSPVLADLDGDNLKELVFATADGEVHAMRPDGSELDGWPVRGDTMPIHPGAPAYRDGAADGETAGAFLASVAVGDLDRDGAPEVVGADFEGRIYVWSGEGRRLRRMRTNPKFSGRPLEPFVSVRRGNRHRVQPGFIGSPVLADLDGDDEGRLEIVAAAMDRHVYAFEEDGEALPGFPVLVVDPGKVDSIDPETHMVGFRADAGPSLDQGAIIDTPAVGDIAGDARPEIVVGTNEEYAAGQGSEGPLNAGRANTTSIAALEKLNEALKAVNADILDPANSRVYAIDVAGAEQASTASAAEIGRAFVAGWPVPVARLIAELLPVVGEGVTGAPVIGPVSCPADATATGARNRVAVIPDAGVGYVLRGNGTSCIAQEPDEGGGKRDVGLAADLAASPGKTDLPAFPAVGHPAFGRLTPDLSPGGAKVSGKVALFAPASGLIRAVDVALADYQLGGQDFVAGWDPSTGQFLPGWPARVNDLQFLTGPSIADVSGDGLEEVLAGTASMDLHAFSSAGADLPPSWPKLTGDWTVANPLVGDFGVAATDPNARQTVISLTRNGALLAYRTPARACSPASWPRFHHDAHNSGSFDTDAAAPGSLTDTKVLDDGKKIEWIAPGEDTLCGTATSYEAFSSNSPIEASSLGRAEPLAGAPAPAAPGAKQSMTIPDGAGRFVALRAVDEAGNPGRLAVFDRGPRESGGGGGHRPPAPPPAPPGQGLGGEQPGAPGQGVSGQQAPAGRPRRPGRPRIKLRLRFKAVRARRGGRCVRSSVGISLGGADRLLIKRFDVYLRGRRVLRDSRPPFKRLLRRRHLKPGRAYRLRIRVLTTDRQLLSFSRRLRACPRGRRAYR